MWKEQSGFYIFFFQCNTNIYLKLKWCLLLKRRDHCLLSSVSDLFILKGK